MIKVYIASPYTIGDKAENVRKSFEVANKLIDLGFIPYCPLYNHYLSEMQPRSEQVWLDMDLAWLAQCDIVIRIPGESKGADMEVEFAHKHQIPVIYTSIV